jgi:hypothetical protein
MAERIQQSLLARFPSHAAEDALPFIGQDRVMAQVEGEAVSDYRRRLLGWRGRWGHRYRGNALALLRLCLLVLAGALRAQGVWTVDRRGNLYNMTDPETFTAEAEAVTWDWDGAPPSPEWARGWIIAYVNAQPWDSWTEMLTTVFAGDSTTSSMGMKNWRPSRSRAIRGLVTPPHAWKMAGSRAEYVLYVLEGDDTFPAPDGTWGRYWGSTKPGTMVLSRLKPDSLG